jgi:hypothetical protein
MVTKEYQKWPPNSLLLLYGPQTSNHQLGSSIFFYFSLSWAASAKKIQAGISKSAAHAVIMLD